MKSLKTDIKWGVIFYILSVLWILLLAALGYTTEKIAQFTTMDSLFFIIAILVYIMAFREKRKKQGNQLTWLQAFISGTIIGVVVMILAAPTQLLLHKILIPDFFENSIQNAVDSGNMTLTTAKEYFNLKRYIIQSIIFAPIAGALTGAVIGLFMKRK